MLIALVPACVARLASAEPPPVHAHGIKLEVERTRGALVCPDASALRDGVVERLGYDPFGSPVERVVTASLDGTEKGFSATVSLRGADGRSLGLQELRYELSTCDELAAAIELAIAVAIDPLASAHPEPRPEGPRVEGPATPTSATTNPTTTSTATATHESLHTEPRPPLDWRVSASAAAVFRAAPTTVPALAAGLELHSSRVSLGLEVRGDFAGYEHLADGSINTSLLVGEMVPCYHWGALGACGLIGAGARQSAGVGLTPSHAASELYFALGARVAVDLAITDWLWARPQVELWVPTTSTTLTVVNQPVWTSPAVSPVAGIALVAAITKNRATP